MNSSSLLDQVREVIRRSQFSYSTEKTYISWIYRYMVLHGKRHPRDMGEKEIADFLTHLAVSGRVSASTQNQALNALAFLYKKVLGIALDQMEFRAARTGRRLPVVLSREEVHKVLSNLQGEFHLMSSLQYGSGLRLMECSNLRIKDIDFALNEILVRRGKGDHDRRTILPGQLISQLRRQIAKARLRLEENMLLPGFRGASMPVALEKKYPNAAREPAWQYLFPSRKPVLDPRSGSLKQHFRHESYLQKAVKAAVRRSKILKNASCHSFRHSFATHLLENGYDIRTFRSCWVIMMCGPP